MVDSANPHSQTILLLYDEKGHVLDLTSTVPPYSPKTVINHTVWANLSKEDATVCQAAIMRCVATGEPQTFDVVLPPLGVWRTTIYRVRCGKARIIAKTHPVPRLIAELTARQREICALLGAGLSSREIAHKLDLARETIDNHRAGIAKRLKIKPHSLPAWCGEHREWF